MKDTNKPIKLFIFFLYIIIAVLIIDFQTPQKTIAAELDQDIIHMVNLKNNYKIGIGDVLDIVTWKEADFSRENIVVRLDGMISFPLLDDIAAAGLTPLQLKSHISSLLKKFIESPNVTVVVRSPASQRFYILGEVARTGEYAIQKELTIIQAFAMAGGFTEWATKKEIILIRKKPEGGTDVIKVDYKKLSQGKGLENNITLKADDTIIVP
jgi:polysaccharide export outer membrane protein